MVRYLKFIFLCVVFCGVHLPSKLCCAEKVIEVTKASIESFISGMLDQAVKAFHMENESERYQSFLAILKSSFAIKETAMFMVGSAYDERTGEEQSEYCELLKSYMVRLYLEKFDAYGKNFKREDFRLQRSFAIQEGGPWIVKTILTLNAESESTSIFVDWMIDVTSGKPRIIDVSIENISVVQTKRSEFLSVLSSKGWDALIQKIKEKTSE